MQEELLTEGFKKKAEELNKEMYQLKEDIKTSKNNKPSVTAGYLDGASLALVAELPGINKVYGLIPKAISEIMNKIEIPW